jgi:hypothetical protein
LPNRSAGTYPAVILNDVPNIETPPPSRNGSCSFESHGGRKKSTVKKKKVHELSNLCSETHPAVILNDVLNVETPPPSRNGSYPLESHGRRKKSTVKKKKVHELSNLCSETYPAVILNDVSNVETPPPSRNGACPLESHGRRKKSTVKKKKENDYLVKCDFPTCPGNVRHFYFYIH